MQPVAILAPVLFTVATFYQRRAWAALEPSLAEAFAALLWLSLIHVPLYFAPRAASQHWPKRAAVAGLLLAPTVILGVIVYGGVMRWSQWVLDAGAAWRGAQYLLALASLIIHASALAMLLCLTSRSGPCRRYSFWVRCRVIVVAIVILDRLFGLITT